ncbi:hypothetical protein A0H76_1854 [Hepatospora eriocheir]|uniref:Uncharacterized protein n=1 Tax=Hepatospora eriocheir TaxID=1081669 RepID=A0A1X0QKF2_9MICR|nr:hypothetical protein A0H76_1854 [Hepatospora eriocheir]
MNFNEFKELSKKQNKKIEELCKKYERIAEFDSETSILLKDVDLDDSESNLRVFLKNKSDKDNQLEKLSKNKLNSNKNKPIKKSKKDFTKKNKIKYVDINIEKYKKYIFINEINYYKNNITSDVLNHFKYDRVPFDMVFNYYNADTFEEIYDSIFKIKF